MGLGWWNEEAERSDKNSLSPIFLGIVPLFRGFSGSIPCLHRCNGSVKRRPSLPSTGILPLPSCLSHGVEPKKLNGWPGHQGQEKRVDLRLTANAIVMSRLINYSCRIEKTASPRVKKSDPRCSLEAKYLTPPLPERASSQSFYACPG